MTAIPHSRLLVVDDQHDLVTAFCRLLEAEGYWTTGVESGAAAIEALRGARSDDTSRFDMLITDLTMPDMDGIALLRAAHAIDADLVSIVMTGHGTIHTAVEAMKGGALDYILKPFNLRAVTPVLARALAVRRLRIDNTALHVQVAQRTAELEPANRELRAANRELETFARSISHDLRQPLNHIIGFAGILDSEKPGALNDKQKEFVGHIFRGGQRLFRLTDDLLQFCRLSQEPMTKQDVRVDELVSDILRPILASDSQQRLEIRVSALPNVQADPALLRQVFANLLTNAVKYSGRVAHPCIEVSGNAYAGSVSYCVRDNGAGFDMLQSQRLFGIFQRLHSDAEFDGTGVGLSIVHKIIERHGGTISAVGEVGKGASFTFALPNRA